MALLAENKAKPSVPNLESRQNDNVIIRKVQPTDYTEILTFLRRNFFLNEPINASIGLLKGDPTSTELEAHCLKTLRKGFSFLAEINGHLAGVIINSIIYHDKNYPLEQAPNPQEPLKFSDSADAKFVAIGNLMKTVAARIDLFRRYPNINSILDSHIISVHPAFQKKGIAGKLLQTSKNLAIEQNVSLLLCMCSSHYSALAVKRLGYQCIHELPYTEYKDSTGKPVFAPEPPHRCMAAYIYPLAT